MKIIGSDGIKQPRRPSKARRRRTLPFLALRLGPDRTLLIRHQCNEPTEASQRSDKPSGEGVLDSRIVIHGRAVISTHEGSRAAAPTPYPRPPGPDGCFYSNVSNR